MAVTAAGQHRLLASLLDAGRPLTLDELRARCPDLDGADVGRGIARLAMMGAAAMSREGGTLRAAITGAGARIAGRGAMRGLRTARRRPPPQRCRALEPVPAAGDGQRQR